MPSGYRGETTRSILLVGRVAASGVAAGRALGINLLDIPSQSSAIGMGNVNNVSVRQMLREQQGKAEGRRRGRPAAAVVTKRLEDASEKIRGTKQSVDRVKSRILPAAAAARNVEDSDDAPSPQWHR